MSVKMDVAIINNHRGKLYWTFDISIIIIYCHRLFGLEFFENLEEMLSRYTCAVMPGTG